MSIGQLKEVIVIAKNEPFVKFVVNKVVNNKYILAEITPLSKPLSRFGSADIECIFLDTNNSTNIESKITSQIQTSIHWRIFIKLIAFILKLQSKSNRDKFIKHVENCA